MSLRVIWLAAAIAVVAWLGLFPVIARKSPGNAYAGYGVFIALYAAALPALAVACAVLATMLGRGRTVLGGVAGIAALDEPMERSLAADRLFAHASLWRAPCSPDDVVAATTRALQAARALAHHWQWTLDRLLPLVHAACPAFSEPLFAAILDVAYADVDLRRELVTALRRADATGAWLRRAEARVRFSPAELAPYE